MIYKQSSANHITTGIYDSEISGNHYSSSLTGAHNEGPEAMQSDVTR